MDKVTSRTQVDCLKRSWMKQHSEVLDWRQESKRRQPFRTWAEIPSLKTRDVAWLESPSAEHIVELVAMLEACTSESQYRQPLGARSGSLSAKEKAALVVCISESRYRRFHFYNGALESRRGPIMQVSPENVLSKKPHEITHICITDFLQRFCRKIRPGRAKLPKETSFKLVGKWSS